MNTEKFHNMLSTRGRAGKSSGEIQPKSEDLRMSRTDAKTPSPTLKAKKAGVLMHKGRKLLSHLKIKGEYYEYYSFLHSFVLFGASTDWMIPVHIHERRASLFNALTQMLISSRNNFHKHT